MSEFKPPKLNRVVIGICKWGLPLELWRAQVQLHVVDNGLKRFLQFKHTHSVIVCNHSNQYDPEVMFAFSKLAGEHFHFITARDVFDWLFGLVGWWFQSLGCYSVARGKADVESFNMTRQIILEGKQKVVLFPEGEVTRQPDLLLPLRRGAIHLLLQAQAELLKQSSEPVLVIPMAIRWRYKYDITPWLSLIMRVIEGKLNIRVSSQNLVDRVRYAGERMLAIIEQEYFCPAREDLSFEERVCHLRERILSQISQLVNVTRSDDGSHLAWLRKTTNAINAFLHERRSSMSAFQIRMHDEQCRKLKRFLADIRRVQLLIGVVPASERMPMTQERLASMVSKLERLVTGIVLPKGPRIAMVAVGDEIPLLDFWPQYQFDEDAAIDSATRTISSQMQSMIDDLHRMNVRILEQTKGRHSSPV